MSWNLRFISAFLVMMLFSCKPSLSRSIFELIPLLSLAFGQRVGLTLEVSGLEGKGLKVQVSFSGEKFGSSEMEISSNGTHRTPLEIPAGSQYQVSILQQPSNPTQVCELGGSSGVMTILGAIVSLQCKTTLPSVAMPYFSPPAGEYPSAVSVTITSSTPSSQIFYTTDGSEPSCNGSGLAYTSPVFIPQPSLTPVMLKAIACLNGEASFVQLGSYRVTNGMLSPPTSSLATNPPAPNYTSAQTTTLSPPPSPTGVSVHYTTDGSTPTCSSPSTPNPLNIPNSMTIQAIACHPDWTASVIVNFPYIITGTVDTPSFSVSGGTYTNDQNVSLTVITPGASIRYELAEGAAPATPNCSASTLYTGPIHVNQTDTQIQAIGCLTGWTDSPVSATQTYTLNVANPVLNPFPPTDVTTSQTVTASSSTTSATYHFTTDGTPPTCASSSTPPVIVADATEAVVTVKVIACRTGFNPSSVVSGDYTKTGTLAPPTFSPVAGTYTSAQTVIINPPGSPAGVQIHYRTDGTPADCSDTLYTTPINVSSSQTITAISCKSSPAWNPSTVASASYTITGTVATPTFSPPEATYNDVQSVNITSSTTGATVYYNWAVGSDPTNPTCGSGYTSLPFSVTKTDTRIRAIACLLGWADSAIASAVYTLRPDTPVPDLATGTYGNAITINFTSSTGATIHIKSGNFPPADPTCTDPAGSSINIPAYSGLRYVKAIACRTDFTPSLVFSGNYSVNGQVTAPTLSSLNQNNEITVTANTPPAIATQTLCYTTTGTDPQCSTTNGGSPDINGGFCASGSTPYTAAVQFTTTTDFRVRACATNHNQSNVVQQTVTISGTVGAVSSSHPTGTYHNDLTSVVTLSATSSTHIYYRMDGTNPDCSGVGSTLYSTAFTVTPTSGSANVKAIGCAAGKTPSSVATFDYTFVVATPTFSEASGTKNNDISVAISTTTTGATLKYQFGTDPTCSSSTYSSPVNLPSAAASPTVDLRAIGCKLNYHSSSVALSTYTFETAVPTVKNHITGAIIPGFSTALPPSTIRWESTTNNARFCLHVVEPPSSPNPTCNGTTGNCGPGMIDLGLNNSPPQIYNYSGANAIRTAVRVCKQYYNAHTALTSREFTSLGGLRMFVSQSSYDGNLGGILGADEKCNSDSNRPITISPYLAFVSHATNRSASAVYIPNFKYYRPDLTTEIFTANPSGMPTGTLVNSVSTTSTNVWTGFGSGFTVGGNCLGWTSNSGVDTGYRGDSGVTSSDWYTNITLLNCNSSYKLYCVESRYRMWVTNNTYDGNLGGISGADAKCNNMSDSNHPKSGKYKALLLVAGSRTPSLDWVFKPGVAYYRTDRTTLIGVTNYEGKLPATLTNSITASGFVYWTGSSASWYVSLNCSGFTSNLDTVYGTNGLSSATNTDYLSTPSSPTCNSTGRHLLCVEQ